MLMGMGTPQKVSPKRLVPKISLIFAERSS